MKEKELRQHATCAMCGNKVMATGLPSFWRVTIERFGVDMRAVERQQGLTMMLGGSAVLAAVMGPDDEMARQIVEPVTLTVCENCCTENTCVARLAELTPNAKLIGGRSPSD